MTIIINGAQREIVGQETISLPDLIKSLEIGEHPLLVELNREALLTREFDHQQINDGDELEIIRMVAGG